LLLLLLLVLLLKTASVAEVVDESAQTKGAVFDRRGGVDAV
jgi:hypothetical protein